MAIMWLTFLIIFHFNYRMNQRGITKGMVMMVLYYGRVQQDRYILNTRDVQSLLNAHQRKPERQPLTKDEIRLLKKILDKGGLVVVEMENRCITAYNFNSKDWWHFKPHHKPRVNC